MSFIKSYHGLNLRHPTHLRDVCFGDCGLLAAVSPLTTTGDPGWVTYGLTYRLTIGRMNPSNDLTLLRELTVDGPGYTVERLSMDEHFIVLILKKRNVKLIYFVSTETLDVCNCMTVVRHEVRYERGFLMLMKPDHDVYQDVYIR